MKSIFTEHAPRAVGPYSQAISAGDFVFCSGQIGIDPSTNNLVDGEIKDQTIQVIKNLEAVLKASGMTLEHVVKTDVFLKNMEDYKVMNETYGEFFKTNLPARVTVEVSRLPKDALVEISCVAYKK